MANWDGMSTSYLLSEVGRRLGDQIQHRKQASEEPTPEQQAELATWREYDGLWSADGPLSKKAEQAEETIRTFCVTILDRS